MASKLELDQYFLVTKKDLEKRGGFLDKRKFRSQQTPREKTLKLLIEALESIGIRDSSVISEQLMKIKRIYQLNKLLLCIVYKYYESKDFSLENVTKNFDEDFLEQLNFISGFPGFKKLNNKGSIFKFRQDFIIYLFLLDEFYQSTKTEEYYYEDKSSSYDSSGVDVFVEEPEFPDDAGFD